MKIRRKSILDQKIYEMDIDVTADQVKRFINRDEKIQDIFPNLTPGEREFILNGITPEKWTETFGEEVIE